jgi:hypothetical protein
MLTKKQYASWTELLTAAYHHGLANMEKTHLDKAKELLMEDLDSSFLRGADTPCVRPSGGVNCAAMTQLIAQGYGRSEGDDLPRMLFATGHFHHNLAYAALMSALPKEAFHLEVEEEVDLTMDWWPKADGFKQQGHIDLQLRCLDPEWLAPGVPQRIVADIKTKHSLGMRNIKDIIEPASDIWGNLDQLAIYSDLKGTTDGGALLIYINREAPKKDSGKLKVQYVFPEHLKEALGNVKRRVGAWDGPFYPELWDRKQKGDKNFMPCQGYCSVQAECEARREGWEV